MDYLVDTNVLLRYIDRANPHHPIARSALRKLRTANCRLHATPQNFAEFWNVMTRPVGNYGLAGRLHKPTVAWRSLNAFAPGYRNFQLLMSSGVACSCNTVFRELRCMTRV